MASLLPPPTPISSLPPTDLPESYLTQSESDALKASVFQRLHPRLYLDRFLAEDVRPDGRAVDGFRGVSVNVGSLSTADGSALVRMGNTTVVCGVKAEIAEPELDRGGEGFLVPNLDLPAMCSPKFKPGPPNDEAQVLSDRLNQTLITSNFLPLTTLTIEPKKSVWVLYVDATCINYDGNAYDATLLAMVAALRNTTLPQATYDPETDTTRCSRTAPRVPLSLNASTPVGVSFGIFDSKAVLADPTSFEEPLLDACLSVVVGDEGKIVSVAQYGSTLVSVSGQGDDEDDEDDDDQDVDADVDDDEGKDRMASGKRRDALAGCVELAKIRRAQLVESLSGSGVFG